MALPLVVAVSLGPARVFGYYSNVTNLHVGGQLLHWAGIDLFLLAFSTGMVLVPGALIALARPRGRAETSFAALAVVFGAGLVAEAALYASNGSARFQERYLFALLPLVPIAFGLYVKHGRPARIPVALISLFLFAVSATLPLSGYSGAIGKTDSPFLTAVFRLETAIGTAERRARVGGARGRRVRRARFSSLAVAAPVTRSAPRLRFVFVTSFGAAIADSANAREVRHAVPAREPVLGRRYRPPRRDAPSDRGRSAGTARSNSSTGTARSLPWRSSVRRCRQTSTQRRASTSRATGRCWESAPTCSCRTTPPPHGLRTPASSRAQARSLWVGRLGPTACAPRARPLLRRLARAAPGRLSVWPDAAGNTRGTLSFTLSLPPSANDDDRELRQGALRDSPRREDHRDLHARRARPLVTAVLDGERGQRSPTFASPACSRPRPCSHASASRVRTLTA